eukprot:5747101-Pyramimonas_sp.AAC.1
MVLEDKSPCRGERMLLDGPRGQIPLWGGQARPKSWAATCSPSILPTRRGAGAGPPMTGASIG